MQTTTGHLVKLLADRPSSKDYRHLRVQWLLDMAAVLDGVAIDGAADLATKARDLAFAVIDEALAHTGRGAA